MHLMDLGETNSGGGGEQPTAVNGGGFPMVFRTVNKWRRQLGGCWLGFLEEGFQNTRKCDKVG